MVLQNAITTSTVFEVIIHAKRMKKLELRAAFHDDPETDINWDKMQTTLRTHPSLKEIECLTDIHGGILQAMSLIPDHRTALHLHGPERERFRRCFARALFRPGSTRASTCETQFYQTIGSSGVGSERSNFFENLVNIHAKRTSRKVVGSIASHHWYWKPSSLTTSRVLKQHVDFTQ